MGTAGKKPGNEAVPVPSLPLLWGGGADHVNSGEKEIETAQAFRREICLRASDLFSCRYWVRGKVRLASPFVCGLSWVSTGFDGFRGKMRV